MPEVLDILLSVSFMSIMALKHLMKTLLLMALGSGRRGSEINSLFRHKCQVELEDGLLWVRLIQA